MRPCRITRASRPRTPGQRNSRWTLFVKGSVGVAIYHLSAKVIGRKGGRSSVAAAAYRAGGRLRDERQGIEHDYSRKGGVMHAEILAPENAPDWMRDRDRLWNAVEAVERRKDAQLAREIEVALPRELDRGERLELLRGFVQRQFVDRGMIADLAVHEGRARDGHGQPHAHVMLTLRELTGDGFGKKDRSWNEPELLMGWREAWARDANAALERAGRSERIDHRSLPVQRAEAERQATRARDAGQEERARQLEIKVVELSREPEPKIGPAANALEKRGIRPSVAMLSERRRRAMRSGASLAGGSWSCGSSWPNGAGPLWRRHASGWGSFGSAPRQQWGKSRRG